MTERIIMDLAGDLWTVEDARAGQERSTRTLRCRHELGYELLITVGAEAPLHEGMLVDALERARRLGPDGALAEAA